MKKITKKMKIKKIKIKNMANVSQMYREIIETIKKALV